MPTKKPAVRESDTPTAWPTDWPAWVLSALHDLERIEATPSDRVLRGAPEWVDQMLAAQMKLIFPSVQFGGQTAADGPHFLGSIVGHLQSMLKGERGIEWCLTQIDNGLEEIDQRLRAKLSRKAYRALVAQGRRMAADFERFGEELERAIERQTKAVDAILSVAASQPVAEQQPFFSAFAAALAAPAYDDGGQLRLAKVSSTPAIYFLMTIAWRPIVTHMGNTTVLHRWLCRLLGPQQVGDLDRVKKICARFKVRLAGRGRPRKKGH